jgi:cysteine desulfurase
VPGIVGLGKATELAMESLTDGTVEHVAGLRDRLEAGVLRIAGTGVNGAGAPRAANTTNIRFEQVGGEALVIALDLKGVAVSGGSACHSGSTEPSHVLMAMGLDKNAARASLRFSLLRTATEEDVDQVLRVVPQAVEHLRALAPVETATSF